MTEKPIPEIEIPTLDEIDEYVPVVTPMDKKTIINAIQKRIPEVRRVQLVEKDKANHRYALVLLCETLLEVAIIIEDDFNMMMRHKDLMNLVDRLYDELRKRKKGIKNNKLPRDFLHNDQHNSFRPFQA